MDVVAMLASTRGLQPPPPSSSSYASAPPQQQAGGAVLQLFPTRANNNVAASPSPPSTAQERPRPEAKKTAPLTIVYGGQVLVFEHYTEEEADRLIQRTQLLVASSGGNSNVVVHTPRQPAPEPMPPPRNMPPAVSDSGVSGSMPIARKASLQRFLQKRKPKYY
uniref:Protein TIFY n=1 Tax=Leersia perrieri TaxID=77586 RepID=A0A0D9VUW9_9ORYZ